MLFSKLKEITLFLMLVYLCSSCDASKQIVYLQGDTLSYNKLNVIKPKVVRIQPDDIIGISVMSLSEDFNKLFEISSASGLRYVSFPGGQTSNQGLQPLGYEVDSLGFIEMPLVGKLKVSNMTIPEASDSLRVKLSLYLKNPTVTLRFLNHKFTILGEVNRPSTYNLLDNKLSVIEAIGLAGDMTIYGRRDNVMLIREENGQRIQVRLNLLSREILSSPYYFLRNGDVIYVEPSKVKSTYNDRTYQILPITTSIISAVTSLGVLLLNVTK